jgi:hypothetical protein
MRYGNDAQSVDPLEVHDTAEKNQRTRVEDPAPRHSPFVIDTSESVRDTRGKLADRWTSKTVSDKDAPDE